MSYRCSKCGLGVIVVGVEKPIYACNCEEEKIVNGEKVIKKAHILCDMEAKVVGSAKMSVGENKT